MLTWPAEIEYPDSSGYSLTMVDVTTRTQFGDGKSRTRRRAINAPTTLKCSWLLLNEQVQVLWDFYRDAVRMGSDSFIMPVWWAGAYHAQVVQFQGPPQDSYGSMFHSMIEASFTIEDRVGTSLWYDLALVDINTTRSLAALSNFRVPRIDIYVRVAADSGGTDTVSVGWSGDIDALVTPVDVTAIGHTKIVPGGANAGIELDGLAEVGPKTIQTLWTSTGGAPTVFDAVVIVPYKDT